MNNQRLQLAIFSFSLLLVCFFVRVSAEETSGELKIVYQQSFESAIRPSESLTGFSIDKEQPGRDTDAPIQTVGVFDGIRSGLELPIGGAWTYWEFEFDVYPDLDAAPKNFMPILNTKEWRAGSFHCELTGQDLGLFVNQGEGDRCRLSYRNIPYKKWSRVRFVVDAQKQQAELFVNGKSLDRQTLVLAALDMSGLYLGFDPDTSLVKPRFKGKLANLAIRGKKQTTRADRDKRYIQNGYEIPRESYCDQPYIVIMKDGTWVCVETTAPGQEGSQGQHLVAIQSRDQGKTWGQMYDIEPSGALAASWGVPLITDFDRIYVFYTYNGDAVHLGRDDTHGWYAYKYSDDGGKTWSRRLRIPVRQTRCDNLVKDGKLVQMFWGICKPQKVGTDVYFSFTKLGKYFMENGEGWVLRSANILSERDPAKIAWELLPEGEAGIRNPDFGSIQEEHNIVPLNQSGGFFCVYRTTQGFPAVSYSYDSCKSWSKPTPMTNAWGRPIFNPRACPKVWKCENGKYLFWFHNNSSRSFDSRNPAWLAAGIERNGKILWSEPEIILFDLNRNVRMSYPDLVEADGQYWISETQKTIGRIHPIDRNLLNSMWTALENSLAGKPNEPQPKDLILALKAPASELRADAPQNCITIPRATEKATEKAAEGESKGGLSEIGAASGFTFDCFLIPTKSDEGASEPLKSSFKPGDVLFDNKTIAGDGVTLSVGIEGRLLFNAKSGGQSCCWTSGPGAAETLRERITVIADFSAGILTTVVDGHLTAPGQDETADWGRLALPPEDLSGTGVFSLHPAVQELKVYSRPLGLWETL